MVELSCLTVWNHRSVVTQNANVWNSLKMAHIQWCCMTAGLLSSFGPAEAKLVLQLTKKSKYLLKVTKNKINKQKNTSKNPQTQPNSKTEARKPERFFFVILFPTPFLSKYLRVKAFLIYSKTDEFCTFQIGFPSWAALWFTV